MNVAFGSRKCDNGIKILYASEQEAPWSPSIGYSRGIRVAEMGSASNNHRRGVTEAYREKERKRERERERNGDREREGERGRERKREREREKE